MALQDCILRLRQSVIYRKWIICSQSKNKTRLTILLDGLSIGDGERTRTPDLILEIASVGGDKITAENVGFFVDSHIVPAQPYDMRRFHPRDTTPTMTMFFFLPS